MAQVNAGAKNNFENLEHVGVGICTTKPGQRHTGVLIQYGDLPVRFLHLAFHFYLKNDLPSSTLGWIQCGGLDREEAHDFAQWINEVWVQNGNRIPYGINYWRGAHFSENGKFIPSTGGDGLTCATFVMALFENFGWELLDSEKWPVRASDQEFQIEIVTALQNPDYVEQTEENKAHHAAQIQYIGSASRFRPEEVAAAVGDWRDTPLTQVEAEAAGIDVVSQLNLLGA